MDKIEIKRIIEKSKDDHLKTLSYINTGDFNSKLSESIDIIYESLQSKGCIFTCGNGGSFSDAQHFTAELVIRYKRDRYPLSSITLGSNFSNLSACSNDYSFDEIFKREYIALSKINDILLAISTSGNSRNIRNIIDYADQKKRKWILLTSDKIIDNPKNGIIIKFPFTSTAAVQESHIFTLQLICKAIDDLILGTDLD